MAPYSAAFVVDVHCESKNISSCRYAADVAIGARNARTRRAIFTVKYANKYKH